MTSFTLKLIKISQYLLLAFSHYIIQVLKRLFGSNFLLFELINSMKRAFLITISNPTTNQDTTKIILQKLFLRKMIEENLEKIVYCDTRVFIKKF